MKGSETAENVDFDGLCVVGTTLVRSLSLRMDATRVSAVIIMLLDVL